MAIDADPRTILTRAAPPASRTTAYGPDPAKAVSVSYTHLTLPTILLV